MSAKKIFKALKIGYFQLLRVVCFFVFRLFKPHNLSWLKNALARSLYDGLGRGCIISPDLFVFNGDNFSTGSGCSFGYTFKVFDFSSVMIGDGLLASHNVTIISGTHEINKERTYLAAPIKIGDNVWIGANVVIVGPCVIGNDCIIGANSFVTGNISAGCIYAGSPAKFIRKVDCAVNNNGNF
ncbi:DapH/DapD/GlmU-related protein [Sphaerotilus sp.]|uniref:acyltransferase n=1 Tax=Sphaerotilus sp. TaxID=2093942 RepID=UPI00286E355A|nr:DapH/DapD/GlmU-related protein [Sphaerotilus sp.]